MLNHDATHEAQKRKILKAKASEGNVDAIALKERNMELTNERIRRLRERLKNWVMNILKSCIRIEISIIGTTFFYSTFDHLCFLELKLTEFCQSF